MSFGHVASLPVGAVVTQKHERAETVSHCAYLHHRNDNLVSYFNEN